MRLRSLGEFWMERYVYEEATDEIPTMKPKE